MPLPEGGIDEMGGSGDGKCAGGGKEVVPRMSVRSIRNEAAVGLRSQAATSPASSLGGGNSPHAMIGTLVGRMRGFVSDACPARMIASADASTEDEVRMSSGKTWAHVQLELSATICANIGASLAGATITTLLFAAGLSIAIRLTVAQGYGID